MQQPKPESDSPADRPPDQSVDPTRKNHPWPEDVSRRFDQTVASMPHRPMHQTS